MDWNDLEAFGMITCFVTLYAGLLFYMNVLTSKTILFVAEITVIVVIFGFIVFATSELCIEYALSVSSNPQFIRFVLRYHKFISCCCKFSARTKGNLEALHGKLQRRFHMEADELMHVQKFKRKIRLSIASKGKEGNGSKQQSSTKVSPSTLEEAESKDDVTRLKHTRKKFGAGSPEYLKELEGMETKK